VLIYEIFSNVRERDHLEDLIVDGRIILKSIFKKWVGRAWIGVIWIRAGTSHGLLWTR